VRQRQGRWQVRQMAQAVLSRDRQAGRWQGGGWDIDSSPQRGRAEAGKGVGTHLLPIGELPLAADPLELKRAKEPAAGGQAGGQAGKQRMKG
jgi:hypothetical protein